MENISLRKATLKDIPALKSMYVDTIQHVTSNEYDAEQRKVWSASAKKVERWEDAVNEQYFILAEIANEIVGFASLLNANYIDFLYVHKDHQRKGIAHLLFSDLEKKAKELGSTNLSSDVSKTARPFFEAKGFKVVNENVHLIDGVEIRNYRMER